jgi:transcription elongation factor GreB
MRARLKHSVTVLFVDPNADDSFAWMSKAFTREENEGPELPDLPPLTSTLPPGAKNYMTRAGADRLRTELVRLLQTERPKIAGLSDDADAKRRLLTLDQRIFRLEQSLESAEVISPNDLTTDTVRFGTTVTVREQGGGKATYRIVGVDETDFERGWVSWLSPIARALMNAKIGQRVRLKSPAGEEELEIIGINYE